MSTPQRVQGTSAAAEAYRILRSTVKFAGGERPVRSILVADIDRDDPSGVAEELAASFARAGDRTALVMTDSRVNAGTGAGFSDLLLGGTAETLVSDYANGNLAEIPAGQRANPDLLAGDSLTVAVAALAECVDYVILSSASIPRHSDALSIAPRVDATILVVTSGKTRRPRAIEARDALERVGAHVLGVVMVESKGRRFW